MPRPRLTKSARIRELLQQDPKMPVKDIVATLAAKGVKIPPSMVYYLRAKAKRRARRQQVRQVVGKNGAANPVDLIVKVRSLANEAGGFDNLKQLVEILAN